MKKKIFLIALAVILLTACAVGTLAYFTAEDTAANVITAGNLRIELLENMISKESGELTVFENQTGICPGDEVSKIVQVKNTGGNDAFVRIAVRSVIELAVGTGDETAEGDPSVIGLDIDTENWTEKDGFYYYNEPLPAGETTSPLFTKVTFREEMGNEYMSCTTTLTVYAQAVQKANNGDSALNASGWPELEIPEMR